MTRCDTCGSKSSIRFAELEGGSIVLYTACNNTKHCGATFRVKLSYAKFLSQVDSVEQLKRINQFMVERPKFEFNKTPLIQCPSCRSKGRISSRKNIGALTSLYCECTSCSAAFKMHIEDAQILTPGRTDSYRLAQELIAIQSALDLKAS